MTAQETNVTNAYESTLTSTLAVGATTISVSSTTGSPAVPFYLVIDPGDDAKREVVLVDSSKTSTSFTLSAASKRGQDGTTDVEHSNGAVVAVVPVAALWTDINDRVDAQVAEADHTKAQHDALGLDHGSLSGLADFTADHGTQHDAHDHTTALGTAAVGDLSNVDQTGAASGKALVHNGTNFVIGDHGDFGGLADDDHTQYLNTTRHDTTTRHGSTVVDHGSIGGLADDDHSQYLNVTRHNSEHIGALAYRSTNQSIPDATATAISFSAEQFDTDTMWSSGAPTRLTFTTAGVYVVVGQIAWAGNSTGYRRAYIQQNGSTAEGYQIGFPGDTNSFMQNITAIVVASAADYVELIVQQNSGGALNVTNTATHFPYLSAVKISD